MFERAAIIGAGYTPFRGIGPNDLSTFVSITEDCVEGTGIEYFHPVTSTPLRSRACRVFQGG